MANSAYENEGPSKSDVQKDLDYLNRRISEMETERSSFISHWKELSEFVDPRRGRFFLEDRNKGDKRHKNIINSRATIALRKATAGMFNGAMSPARPWFEYDLLDQDLLKVQAHKEWLDLLKFIVLKVLTSSNFYQMAPVMLRELLLFGTGCMTHTDDFEDVARFYTHTCGSYLVAQNHRQVIDTFARKFQMTAIQMVSRFGYENCSLGVQTNYDRGNYGQWHTVYHFIEPNPFHDPSKLTSSFFPYRSIYFEPGKNKGENTSYLSRKGYKGFPVYVPRWETTNEDVYGTNCPGMTCLGDVKGLQLQEREKAKAIAKNNTPPMQGPPQLRNQPIANLPGGFTGTSATGEIKPLYSVDPRINEMMIDIQATERRIDEGFFTPLFMAVTEMAGIQPKNELQLKQIDAERLLQLGPVLEQIHGEWLSKMVLRVSRQVIAAGIMPPKPPQLRNHDLGLQFVSALAMAQRSVALGSIERTVSFAGALRVGGWDVSDKLEANGLFEDYASLNGFPQKRVVDDATAQMKQAARLQALQQQQALANGQQVLNMAKMASDAKLDDNNILSRATGNA